MYWYHNRIVTGETKDKVEKSSGGRCNRKESSETVEDLQTEEKAVCCRMTHPVVGVLHSAPDRDQNEIIICRI
jgi:hypothetical protein